MRVRKIAWPARMALVLALAFAGPGVAAAQDTDGDGFDDGLEAGGITLDLGVDEVTFPPCAGEAIGDPARDLCVDPATPDLYVILVLANPSNLPSGVDPLAFLKQPVSAGGLGMGIHAITLDQAGDDRTVTSASPQKAVRITESLNTNGETLGLAGYGTPNDQATAVAFSERIKNFVEGVCAGANSCKLSTGEVGAEVITWRYILRTINHEVGHMLMLAADYNRRFGGYHHKAGAGIIMEQSVKYTNKGGKVTFYVSTGFGEASQVDAALQ